MLKVNLAGFAELQAGRPAWNFIRELVSNAWDEDIRTCSVTVEKGGNKLAKITVGDDGPGFADLADAYTLFGHTPKRSDPNVRGRFNLGEKELAAIASEMQVRTTTGSVIFTKARKLEVRKGKDFRTPRGTIITAHINWAKAEVEETLKMLNLFLPPAGVEFSVNGSIVHHKQTDYEIEGTLATVIFKDGAVRPTKRKTKIELYNCPIKVQPWLYEMGIPIQPIESLHHINVMQKVPLSPNRENVSSGYLQDVYALALEAMIDDLPEEAVSEEWVRIASEDELVSDETIGKVRDKRYGDAVLWSSDLEANQLAMEKGLEVIHPRTMSPSERGRFEHVGMVHSSAQFGNEAGRAIKPMAQSEWDEHMKIMDRVARQVWNKLYPYGASLKVEFIRVGNSPILFGYLRDRTTLVINTAKFMPGEAEADPFWFLSLLAHEFAHQQGLAHDENWQKELLTTTAKIIRYVVAELETAYKTRLVFALRKGSNE